ncbi:V/A-type H+-transporting ATPase subunit E [Fibrobacter sp. UWH9]|uniref:ATPase n=1 Tax=unclassified Fibrobacter TaxID=2634177 RepID=UPI000923F509|nr:MULTISPECIES: ATPase [Fibrobacter]MCQ2100015.1 ATPase [Fibrobacter sp.]MCL4102541.1 V-type proton ATPase subunit E [Fibrobacter succinogenes]OWV08081.1 ATPase [Fibrobacter sp. UWH3]PWJ57280.1 V/A-type H+-transporting ATPase subunit E [Fibrobacter sp. UWR4]PZW62742.1 V/A-type H+-transporting ATPase subunit E [Fibrobacter sp. UWR1]
MAEDLQYLMERIQKDAVDKAENDAAAIIAKAKEKAAEIVKAAEAEAQAKLAKADKDAEAFTERSERTLEQSARDLLLSVGKNLQDMILNLLSLQVEKSLDESTVKEMLLSLAKGYSAHVEVDFSEADAKKLASFVTGEFAKQLSNGVEVSSDKGVKYGFRVKLDGGKVTHEFTEKAMADALSALLRPQLAKVVNAAAQAK